MNIGDEVTFRALHADGECYRWWCGTVEDVQTDRIVVWTPKGEIIHQPNGDWPTEWDTRMHVLLDAWQLPEETYDAAGTCFELYININAPVIIDGNVITYTDYELDVSKVRGQPAEIIDQDEFAEAILRYGYSPEHQAACWAAAHEALLLAESWTPQP
jgi:protein associated with RNAse G/E